MSQFNLKRLTVDELETLFREISEEIYSRRCPAHIPNSGLPGCDLGTAEPHEEHGMNMWMFDATRGGQYETRVTWRTGEPPRHTDVGQEQAGPAS